MSPTDLKTLLDPAATRYTDAEVRQLARELDAWADLFLDIWLTDQADQATRRDR